MQYWCLGYTIINYRETGIRYVVLISDYTGVIIVSEKDARELVQKGDIQISGLPDESRLTELPMFPSGKSEIEKEVYRERIYAYGQQQEVVTTITNALMRKILRDKCTVRLKFKTVNNWDTIASRIRSLGKDVNKLSDDVITYDDCGITNVISKYKMQFESDPQFKTVRAQVIEYLDINDADLNNIEVLDSSFKDMNTDRFILDGKSFKNLSYMESTFELVKAREVILRNLKFPQLFSMKKLFRYADIGRVILENIEIQSVTTIENMFYKCHIRNLIMNSLITDELKSTQLMFKNSVIDNLEIHNFNTESCENMSQMFADSKIGNKVLDLSSLTNTSGKLKSTTSMFECAKINKLVMPNIDFKTVQDIRSTFNTIGIKEIELMDPFISNFELKLE